MFYIVVICTLILILDHFLKSKKLNISRLLTVIPLAIIPLANITGISLDLIFNLPILLTVFLLLDTKLTIDKKLIGLLPSYILCVPGYNQLVLIFQMIYFMNFCSDREDRGTSLLQSVIFIVGIYIESSYVSTIMISLGIGLMLFDYGRNSSFALRKLYSVVVMLFLSTGTLHISTQLNFYLIGLALLVYLMSISKKNIERNGLLFLIIVNSYFISSKQIINMLNIYFVYIFLCDLVEFIINKYGRKNSKEYLDLLRRGSVLSPHILFLLVIANGGEFQTFSNICLSVVIVLNLLFSDISKDIKDRFLQKLIVASLFITLIFMPFGNSSGNFLFLNSSEFLEYGTWTNSTVTIYVLIAIFSIIFLILSEKIKAVLDPMVFKVDFTNGKRTELIYNNINLMLEKDIIKYDRKKIKHRRPLFIEMLLIFAEFITERLPVTVWAIILSLLITMVVSI